MRLKFARSHIRIRHAAEFWLIRGVFYFFCLHLIELLFGRVLASVCEVQLPLCVELSEKIFGIEFMGTSPTLLAMFDNFI